MAHSASVYSCGAFRIVVPALFTSMSTRPSSCRVSLTIETTEASSATSTPIPIARAPRLWSSDTARWVFSSSRAETTTDAPELASPFAMPSPIPPLPPVTIATFPLRSNMLLIVQIVLPVLFSNVPLPHERGIAPHLA